MDVNQPVGPVSDPAAQFQLLATIIEYIPVGIIVVDQTGRLILMNDVGRQISGAVPEGVESVAEQADMYALREPGTGRPLAPEETPIARAVAGEVVKDFEYLFRRPGAQTDTWVRVVAAPLQDTQGDRIGAVAVFEDVTEERGHQRAREDFLAAAAHDLRSPLTGIKGFSQLLQRRLAREDVLRRDVAAAVLQQISETAARMEGQILELLDIARLQAGERIDLSRSRVDLVDLVRRIAEEQAATSERHTIEVERGEQTLMGHWDAPRLERAIRNLLHNGVTYSPEGGTVTITVRRENQEGQAWGVVQVRDQGIGIPSQDLPRIFDRFYRGSNAAGHVGGTGIGLASVKYIVEQHGGRVAVESREGAGSTFSFKLPVDSG